MGDTVRMIDIAQACGVSLTTVSLTLNGKGCQYGVAAATQQRILDHVRKVGYVPNADAAATASGGADQIGIIIESDADLLTENQKAIFYALLKRLHEAGKRVLIQVIDEDTIMMGMRFLAGKKAKNIVVLGFNAIGLCTRSSEILPLISARRLLLVDYRFQPKEAMPAQFKQLIRVGIDRARSLSAALHLLLDEGHRRIAMMPAALKYLQGTPMPSDITVFPLPANPFEPQEEFRAGAELVPDVTALMRDQGCTAVMMYDDMMAIGLIDALLNAGIRVPDDVSVSGFDNIRVSAYSRVPLTTVEVPVREMVDVVCRELFDEPSSAPRDYLLDGNVIRRASVGPPPSDPHPSPSPRGEGIHTVPVTPFSSGRGVGDEGP